MSTERLIVVGVDGSDGGFRALTWALAYAAATGATVQVITTFTGDDPPLRDYADSERHRADNYQQRDVAAALATMDHPPVISQQVIAGPAVDVLTAASRGADMLVVGSHGRGRLHTALLGSVSTGCIRQASCPVLVVPTPKPAADERALTIPATRAQ